MAFFAGIVVEARRKDGVTQHLCSLPVLYSALCGQMTYSTHAPFPGCHQFPEPRAVPGGAHRKASSAERSAASTADGGCA